MSVDLYLCIDPKMLFLDEWKKELESEILPFILGTLSNLIYLWWTGEVINWKVTAVQWSFCKVCFAVGLSLSYNSFETWLNYCALYNYILFTAVSCVHVCVSGLDYADISDGVVQFLARARKNYIQHPQINK